MAEVSDLSKYEKVRFTFDVESNGLHGDGFAYGYVVTGIDKDGRITTIEKGELYSLEGAARAYNDPNSGKWLQENVFPKIPVTKFLALEEDVLPPEVVRTDRELRDAFYVKYAEWKNKAKNAGKALEMWADVAWPVEANFLSAVTKDNLAQRGWEMPFPLYDVSTKVPLDISRSEECTKLGLKEHNPMDDTIVSAGLLHKNEQQLIRSKPRAVGEQ